MPSAPLTSPMLPIGRRRATSGGRRRPWTIVASVLLHLAALAIFLTARRAEPPMPVAPSYDLVFENGGSSAEPTAPDRSLDTPSEAPAADLPPTPSLEPPTPPAPTEPQAPAPALEPLPEPIPAEPPAQPAPEPDLAPQPEPAPEAAPTPEPPAVRLGEPGPTPAPLSPQALAPELPALVPPPP